MDQDDDLGVDLKDLEVTDSENDSDAGDSGDEEDLLNIEDERELMIKINT